MNSFSASQRNISFANNQWTLNINLNGYDGPISNNLATQIKAGRKIQILGYTNNENLTSVSRVKIKSLEDGYISWADKDKLFDNISHATFKQNKLFSAQEIRRCIPQILYWIKKQSLKPNKYLWGGTIGPNYDCSGLIQTAFAEHEIWLPRDAYQQEIFCTEILNDLKNLDILLPGDLLFFGKKNHCTHVGIYNGNGFYWHSSSKTTGNNGIGLDQIISSNCNSISSYYQSRFRKACRVQACHDGKNIQ